MCVCVWCQQETQNVCLLGFSFFYMKHQPKKKTEIWKPTLPMGMKRGIKQGQRVQSNLSQAEWYEICESFVNLPDKMSAAEFLRSELSGSKVQGSVSQQQSFGRFLKKFKSDQLQQAVVMRMQKREYEDVERKLLDYINSQAHNSKAGKRGVAWSVISQKCKQWAHELGHEKFKVSPAWVDNILKRNKRDNAKSHEEDTELNDDQRTDSVVVEEEHFETNDEDYDMAPSADNDSAAADDAAVDDQDKDSCDYSSSEQINMSYEEAETALAALHAFFVENELPDAADNIQLAATELQKKMS